MYISTYAGAGGWNFFFSCTVLYRTRLTHSLPLLALVAADNHRNNFSNRSGCTVQIPLSASHTSTPRHCGSGNRGRKHQAFSAVKRIIPEPEVPQVTLSATDAQIPWGARRTFCPAGEDRWRLSGGEYLGLYVMDNRASQERERVIGKIFSMSRKSALPTRRLPASGSLVGLGMDTHARLSGHGN